MGFSCMNTTSNLVDTEPPYMPFQDREHEQCSRDINIEEQALNLSQYNESLANRNSTSMKFDWMQLLGDPAKSGINDKSRSIKEIDSNDNASRLNSDSKHYEESESSDLGGFERKLVDENPGPRIALSSQGLVDPTKPGTNDTSLSLRQIDSKDNATRLISDRKHYGQSDFLGLGGFERKLVDENHGPGLALSSRGLGDPAKSGTNDKSYSSKEIDSDDCHGVNATRLDSESKRCRVSEYSGLGEFERKLVDENPKSGLACSSRGSDESIVYKSLATEIYKEANSSSMRVSQDDNYCMEQLRARPASFNTGSVDVQYNHTGSLALLNKEFPDSHGHNSRVSFGGDRCRAEMINSTIVHDARDVKMCGKSNVTRTYPPVAEEHENNTYNEGSRIKRENVFRESDEFYVYDSVPNDCSHIYFDYAVGKMDECCYEELSGESRVWYEDSYLEGNKIVGNNDLNMSPTRKWDNEVVNRTRAYVMYEREQNVNQRSPFSEDDHGYERSEISPWSEYGQHNVNYDHRSLFVEDNGYETSETFPFVENDQYLDKISNDLSHRLEETESYLIDDSPLILKRKCGVHDMPTNFYIGNTIHGNDERVVNNFYQGGALEQSSAEDREDVIFSKKLRSSHSQFTQSERLSYETMPRSEAEHNSAGKDIMKRLGPRLLDIHASASGLYVKTPKASVRKRLGPVEKSKPSVMQRLGPGPTMYETADSRTENQNSKQLRQRACRDDNNHVKKEPSVTDLISTNAEPHENSEEFKQLVHSAYFRFVKQLNENSVQRRRILEQGKAGRLKCIVCGRNSKEFVDTKSLVVHTFYSQKVGFRALHLGFHRALCMLMGWKNKTAGGHKWFCVMLSDSEALSLKEDHIIWPPVVIIHNSSINSNDVDERVIVSIEALESMLRGMGIGERIKVCRGRPANHSVMAVIFNSTLSGLEAAERLHSFYSKTKHGKSEFENIRSCSSSCTGEASKSSEKKAEHVLYGYLGIAEDLGKLEFETKKRCLVKSKKEIQRITMQP